MPALIMLIPQEIMADILTRLPAKSIGCCRCVSKSWRHLLSGHHFIKAHLNRTKEFMDNELLMLISCYFNTLCRTNIAHHLSGEMTAFTTKLCFVVHSDFLTEGMPSCDGLILIKNNRSKRQLVNPTTNEARELPVLPYALYPRASFTMYGLGYDHVNDDYKVVTLSYCDTDNQRGIDCTEMFVNVYSVRNGTWKPAESSPYDHSVGHVTSGVYASGFVHWIACNTTDYSSVIVGFDLTKEEFCKVAAPSSFDGQNFVFKSLMVFGGCLCIPSWSNDEIEIWVMKEYGVKESWTKFSIVNPEALEFRPVLCMSGQREIVMVKDEDKEDEKLVMYNLDSATFKDITIHGGVDEFHIGGNFVETLVSPYYNNATQRG
ncbi:F-box/kelch-repeat protein At3g06240-like [Silene latifolia]|uniref:F-box/kelch-repeat protein At3g06240-like n=1 Tax=Silene latifolia TaxID=37657 RepID=UPI003D77A04A